MAILNKCCCRLSVRKGAFLSSIYTLIYFFIFALLTGNWAYHEGKGALDNQDNLHNNTRDREGNTEIPTSHVIRASSSYGTIFVLLLDFTCEVIGFFATILLIFGLKMEKKILLLPWIIIVPIHTAIDTYTVIHIMISQAGNFPIEDGESHDNHGNSITIFTIILDFIIISINIYVLLCVISQYQEYCDGRGTAAYEESARHCGGSVQYTGNPTVSQSGQSGRSSQNVWADDLVIDQFNNSEPESQLKKHRKRKESAKGTSVHFNSEPSICDSSSRFLLRPDYGLSDTRPRFSGSEKSSRSSYIGMENTSGEITEQSPPFA